MNKLFGSLIGALLTTVAFAQVNVEIINQNTENLVVQHDASGYFMIYNKADMPRIAVVHFDRGGAQETQKLNIYGKDSRVINARGQTGVTCRLLAEETPNWLSPNGHFIGPAGWPKSGTDWFGQKTAPVGSHITEVDFVCGNRVNRLGFKAKQPDGSGFDSDLSPSAVGDPAKPVPIQIDPGDSLVKIITQRPGNGHAGIQYMELWTRNGKHFHTPAPTKPGPSPETLEAPAGQEIGNIIVTETGDIVNAIMVQTWPIVK